MTPNVAAGSPRRGCCGVSGRTHPLLLLAIGLGLLWLGMALLPMRRLMVLPGLRSPEVWPHFLFEKPRADRGGHGWTRPPKQRGDRDSRDDGGDDDIVRLPNGS